MAQNLVVMPGPSPMDLSSLDTVAEEFGWKIVLVKDPDQVENIRVSHMPLAVLFHRDAFGPGYSWSEAIRLLRRLVPGVSLVALQGFSETADWQELSEAGAFHSLWLPLKTNEVRQSLGFLVKAEPKSPVSPVRYTARLAAGISIARAY